MAGRLRRLASRGPFLPVAKREPVRLVAARPVRLGPELARVLVPGGRVQSEIRVREVRAREREEWTAGRQATKPPSHEVKEEQAKDERAAKSGGGPGKKAA